VTAAAGVALVALMLVQALPALAASYGNPKDDWRAAAQHIVDNSPQHAVVLSVGNYSDWAVLCLGYYLRQLHSPIKVVDGMQMSSDAVDQMNQGPGVTWGILNHPSTEQQHAMSSSLYEQTDFVDVTNHIYVVRSSGGDQSMLEQARGLLHWETALQPGLNAPAKMLDVVAGAAQLGSNLAPEPASMAGGGWVYGPGVDVNAGTLTLTPNGGEVNAAFNPPPLAAGDDYLVAFDHRDAGLRGMQAVYAAVLDAGGHQLTAFPTGSGYVCAPSDGWTRSYFAFRIPQDAATVVLFFRVDGTGAGEFRSVQLSRLTENP
jgi:hypothetical protein